jgi:xanthine dehydrogenase accessory factor
VTQRNFLNSLNTWQFIFDKLSASKDVILLYVLESKGSSPGRQGFKMAVSSDNDFCGTIGGGIMEHKFVEMAKARLHDESDPASLYKQVHDKSATKDQSGMICSGEQTIFFYRMQQEDVVQIAGLIKSLEQNRNGTLQLSNTGITFIENTPKQNFYFQKKTDQQFLFEEKTGYKNTLHIIGGGHCALALSRLMRRLDFYIILYEDRGDLNTIEQNDFVHEIRILDSYSELGGIIEGGENVYVVIMTVGYRTDDIALRSLLNKPFKYIGVLGSKKKIEKMFSSYRQENISPDQLREIHSPIGLDIKSQTTEEIAISIAAEIISVKNNN